MYSWLHIPVVFLKVLTEIEICKGSCSCQRCCPWQKDISHLIIIVMEPWQLFKGECLGTYVFFSRNFRTSLFHSFQAYVFDHSFYTYHFSNIYMCRTAFELVISIITEWEVLVYSSLSIIYFLRIWQYNILCSVSIHKTPQIFFV